MGTNQGVAEVEDREATLQQLVGTGTAILVHMPTVL